MTFTSTSGSAPLHASGQPWLLVSSPKLDARLRLICCAHAGGGPSVYSSWARALERHPIEIAAAALPGHESRAAEPPASTLDTIVDALADAVAARADFPCALFGHSMGAVVAFETARRLRDRGVVQPAYLFVSGASAPQLPHADPRLRAVEDDAEFLAAVARTYGGVPKIVLERADLRREIVAALRADLTLTETYAYRDGAPLACAIAAYGGTDDPIVRGERLDAWRDQTTGGFAIRRFDGDHFYLNRARDALLADLVGRLHAHL
jgi:surfactin synthase thioesterase subunit